MTAPAIAAIPTQYNGVQFRSRLEARWAAMFDLLGWSWEYEPIDLPGWIPDFRAGPKGLLIEVCPESTLVEHQEKIIASGYPGNVVILTDRVRTDSEGCCGDHAGCTCACEHRPVACGISLSLTPGATDCQGNAVYPTDKAVIRTSCAEDGIFCLSEALFSYACMVCGDYDGNSYIMPDDHRKVLAHWREAGNRVQWRGVGARP